jgi:glycosyltransferase involved in cell wall biosynthesis
MGGAEVHLHEIFRRIVKKGHNVTLVAHKFPGSLDEEVIDGIKVVRHGNKYLFDRQFKSYYKSKLKDLDFDLIVDDISKIPLNTPSYISKPIVGIIHHIHGNSLYKELSFPLAYYIVKSEQKIPKQYRSSKIFTVSASTTSELVKLGFDESKTGILYNAIDHNLFGKVNVEKSATPVIAYVGRIKNYKNIDKIIDAVSILKNDIPNIKLIIGGRGDYLDNLKAHVQKLNLEMSVEFTGFLTEEEKAELLGKSWLFITMAEKEGWGITVIEANSMKTPAIGSDVPGLRDSIRNNETGYLVPLGNSAQLADKIRQVISNKSELDNLSQEAFEWSKKFSWDNSADYFLEKVIEWYPQLKSKI